MPTLEATAKVEKELKAARLWSDYEIAKNKFVDNPNLKSLDFCIWDKINRHWSIKITKKIRIIMIKRQNNEYEAYTFGDFHRKQNKK